MKKKLILSGILIMMVLIFSLICPQVAKASDEVTITFNDENLYSAMKDLFEDEITGSGTNSDGTYYITMSQDDIDDVTKLTLGNKDIADIQGLENFTNLTELSLSLNNIADITVLKNLTSLTNLALGYNQLTDITALENLTNLTSLALGNNQLTDITALENLTNLTSLELNNNNIVDISVLSNLTNLNKLYIYENNIEDMTVLEDMEIEKLACYGQEIYVTATNYYVELPEIFIQAQDPDSILYQGDDYSFNCWQMVLSEDGTTARVNRVYSDIQVKIRILAGEAENSTLYIEEYIIFPLGITNGNGNLTIDYDGDYTLYYQAIESDDEDDVVDYNDDDWTESSDGSFAIDSSTYTGTKYFTLWVKLVTSDGTYYSAVIYTVSGTGSEDDDEDDDSSATDSNSSSGSSSDSSSSTSSSESNDDTETEDTTTATTSLPYTGKSAIILGLIVTFGITFIVIGKKVRNLKGI